MKSLKACLFGMVFMLLVTGMSYGSDSAYDQMNGISGDSWHAAKESTKPGSYDDLNSSWENARRGAGQGFDTERSSNLRGGGILYIPVPKPKIEKTENNE
ncbi:hypothetical protein [Sulfurihydrogenibium sp.]|jgi:hypothetical protein|uniref:hypothetical protein n=1 Tax=Sulfurihydrogenibium sp. TaxID=2053621 RepID=UPI00260FAF2A|nr:hypothetical protein [Sulfurihydrogenibium sp.]